ncbi:hypothetical protein DINM_001645 [Dirofilaria immitis]|nr:hypothetical protein [Dirofilaria immitis]
MAQAIQHFKLLMYMKKSKPWRKVNNYDDYKIRSCEKARNVDRICRQLTVNRAPSILLSYHTPRHQYWESYIQKVQHWRQKAKQRKQNGPANSLFIQDQSQLSYSAIQPENMLSSAVVSAASIALLRTFYTVWHIGRISRKSLKTNEETVAALKQLSVSPTVEKCLRITPKGGITAKVITDKSQLSKRALHTLSRWARMTEDIVQDGYESGYDEDPVEIWNRAITLADASYTENEFSHVTKTASYTENEFNHATKTTDDAVSFSTNVDKETPKRRRSNRLLKSVNLEI